MSQNRWVTRANSLRNLGFKSYDEYLASRLWKSIRSRVYAQHKSGCSAKCGRGARCVHHVTYDLETMRGDRLHHLVPLCFDCHHKLEFDADGNRLSEKRSLGVLRLMLVSAVIKAKKTDRKKKAYK